MISPIVDDEGCDFLCKGKNTLAEVIEIGGASSGDGQSRLAKMLGLGGAYLPC